MNELTVKNLIDTMDAQLGEVYGALVSALAARLGRIAAQLDKTPWHSEEEMLVDLLEISTTLDLFPEGVDTALTGELAQLGVPRLGLTRNPTDGDPDMAALAYLLYAAAETEHRIAIADALQTRYQVGQREERFALTDRIVHMIRHDYRGDAEALYADLDRTSPQFTMECRLSRIGRSRAGTPLPGPGAPRP
jgi:hypothetical protein